MFACAIGVFLAMAGPASADVVTLPDTSKTTTFTATVSEQAEVSASSAIAFAVEDVTSSTTNTSNASVSATSIVIDNGNTVKVEIQADASSFSAPTGGSVTWSAANISWDAPTWTGGTGASGELSAAGYTAVATSNANASELSTTALAFTLAAKATVDRAGAHTLAATWKFSSVTP